jgi:hypothetical protein
MTAPRGQSPRARPNSDPEADRMCPSTTAANATVFLGMVTPQRRVAYLTPAIAATPELLESLSADNLESGPLESQYRFAGPCVTSRCGFWTGSQCGLGQRLADSFAEVTELARESPADDLAQHSKNRGNSFDQDDDANYAARMNIPKCAIRGTCRWFAEQGPGACRACRFVVTDSRVLTSA